MDEALTPEEARAAIVKSIHNTFSDRDKRTAEECLRRLNENLMARGTNIYTWTPLGKGADVVWQLRVPREDRPDQAWLKKVKGELVHLCDPMKIVAAVEADDEEALAEVNGLVYDKDGMRADVTTFRCMLKNCRARMPIELAKHGQALLKMYALKKQV